MNHLFDHITDAGLRTIAEKVENKQRINPEEGLLLFKKADLPLLGIMAGIVKRRFTGSYAWFNHNFHIEPTNKCVYNCRFCSYHKPEGDPESWEYSHDQIMDIVKTFDNKPVTEVHIVGGVHPSYDIHYWGSLIRKIRDYRPSLHIKAFSAIELDYMISKAGCTIEEGLNILKDYGLDSIPGGGAEIFDEELRKSICDDKASSELWLKIHETAHMLGIPSNATILYGHIENYSHRIDHLERLRILQDRTDGFNCFIPLKFKKANNKMSYLGEVSIIEDMRNYAVSRIYLDNFPHIKAYWPMIGKEAAQLSLSFGVDDMDGTIDDTTKIFSMAGSKEESPSMNTEEICHLIQEAGLIPVERDSLYNPVKEW
ncbi:MAG: aminofutalosine synthase MqnE [Bacteroidetes bacterium GWE2_41_25]|nr:MAG: aminofutalosine synthase MqnE [Bacteroidetes bacterium GWA2_40_15]OFX93920.1 MAG: aminofutalosine synthase MqnE [Bacteroidetes bacterium GWE2_41_25]OFY00855.1 MAG: aminofutalosine synthase MqnE [Bacteroidetes bacterium GWC2_40_22]HBH83514.1 aminofutalosine synthase MqnE [Bacteroidales bacterium]HBQ84243.1 aminofutalosine synthase MqnE [Bacteroidales bacterium]